MKVRLVRYVLWNGGKWYVKRRAAGPAKVFGVLAAVTVVATIAYVIASNGGEDDAAT